MSGWQLESSLTSIRTAFDHLNADLHALEPKVAAAIDTAFSHAHAEAGVLEKKVIAPPPQPCHVERWRHNVPNVSKDTLLRGEGTYFHALLGSGRWKPDGDPNFLDLDPLLFRRVLIFLRTGKLMSLDGLTSVERDEFSAMLEYLKLDEGVSAQMIPWQCTVAMEPLMGTFQVRVDTDIGEWRIGLGPRDIDVTSGSSMSRCYLYKSTGAFNRKNDQVLALPSLQAGDVVTIRRALRHVEFAVNDGCPSVVNLVDPSEELFPVVFMYNKSKITSLG
ncbi:hypothetical protein H257_07067 [Aphanomyces astaci]|uniref:Potassium channel tetramerisation-type BTB domain-containing protein n=1 Tax=Aphanomyces astaci TaxID=112090 RepID=W4GLS0_APHAT|nr:hypothetical protein H257_07067 [Aphanomyces astaci]ETV79853.1 hypothetical protein H257_07067 [Aphanomyces astaci]|eukprot:XP_009830789.1 hypothetical protein H257_07067 [Aphanomyces astaci]